MNDDTQGKTEEKLKAPSIGTEEKRVERATHSGGFLSKVSSGTLISAIGLLLVVGGIVWNLSATLNSLEVNSEYTRETVEENKENIKELKSDIDRKIDRLEEKIDNVKERLAAIGDDLPANVGKQNTAPVASPAVIIKR